MLSDLNEAQAQAKDARSRAGNLDRELSKLQDALGSAESEKEQLRSTLEQERSSRRSEAEDGKALSNENSRLAEDLDQMRDDHARLSQKAPASSKELDQMGSRLSTMEKKNADPTDEAARIKAKEEEATRELRDAKAARQLAEDREQVLGEQRDRDQARIRALDRRVNELLSQRGALEREMEVTRGSIKNVEANVNALCNLRSRKKAGEEGPSARDAARSA